MSLTLEVQISIILMMSLFFILITLMNQIKERESLKQLIIVQSKIILGIGLFLMSLVFLNSYYYLISSVICYVLKISPVYMSSASFETVLIEKWFVIICTVLMAFVINVALAYYTRFKHLFIAPFEMIIFTTVMMTLLQQSSLSISSQIMMMAVVLGMVMSIAPSITSKLCKGELEGRTTLGLFHYLDNWLCIGVGNLFGKCHLSTEAFVENSNFKRILKKGFSGVTFFLIITTVLLTFIAYFQGYHEQTRLVILNQLIVEGIGLLVINVLILLMGIGCFYGFYRLIISVYPVYLSFFEKIIPTAYFATDWIYQLQHCRYVGLIGFISSYVAALVTLMYLSFYQVTEIVMPELVSIGLIGVLVSKMANQVNGVKGTLIASFMNGILLTVIPTLSLHYLKALQLEGSFRSLDTFFISQLLDRLFIF